MEESIFDLVDLVTGFACSLVLSSGGRFIMSCHLRVEATGLYTGRIGRRELQSSL
jgi:hypothetical protein